MTRIYKVPFATSGDIETLATNEQPDGKVSLATGWTFVYELPDDNPSYKPVGRAETNGIWNEVTAAVGELQLQGGFIKWQSVGGGFNKGAVVYGADMQTLYQNTVDANTTDPDSVGASGWSKLYFDGRTPGEIGTFCFATPPTGWLLADGAEVSRTTYARLFTAIGTTFGVGDGSTTFNLPDLRGEFIRGADMGRGVDAGRTLGSAQSDAIRNITGSVAQLADRTVTVTGAFESANYGNAAGFTTGTTGKMLTFDASLVVPTADENRPQNIALAMFIFAGA